jgi:hypothetical protein
VARPYKRQFYLQGYDVADAAQLIQLPTPPNTPNKELKEPELVSLLNAFDRIIKQARTSLLEDKVNVFLLC